MAMRWLVGALTLALMQVRAVEEATSAATESSSEGSEDAGAEEEEEEGIEALSAFSLATLILCLIALIIFISIGFELAKELLEEKTPETLKPVLIAMFSELTTLGFLSLLTYVMQQSNVFDSISEAIFGFAVVEEVFEEAHMGIFAVAVIFMVSVVVFLHLGKDLETNWESMNEFVQDKAKVSSLREKIIAGTDLGMSKKQATRTFEFLSFRNEFIRKRSIAPPFDYASQSERLSDDFDFGLYLTECYAYTMAKVIELPPTAWCAVLGMLALFYFIMLSCRTKLAELMWVWVVLGYWLVAAMYILHTKVTFIREMMLVPADIPKPQEVRIAASSNGTDIRTSLLVELDRPFWTTLDLPNGDPRGWRMRVFGANKRNRFESMFMFGDKGAQSYVFFMQLMMFCHSIYLTVLAIVFYEFAFEDTSLVLAIIYLIVSLVPTAMLLNNFVKLMGDLIMVISSCTFRRSDVAAKVVRHQKASRAIKTLLLISKLRNSTVVPDPDQHQPHKGGKRRSSIEILLAKRESEDDLTLQQAQEYAKALADQSKVLGDPLTLITEEQIENIGHTFDTFDANGSGDISITELNGLMRSLGSCLTENQLKMTMVMLDVDANGTVSRDEFIWWYAKQLKQSEGATLEEVVRSLFFLIDKDNTGSITLSEFYTTVQSLGSTLELDEVSDLFREIDADQSGSVDREEFEGLILKYLSSDLLDSK